MKNIEPKKFYKLPDKVYFWLHIVILIVSALSIAMIWVSNSTKKWEVGMTFAAFTTCVTLAWGIIGIIHPDKKKRNYAIGYLVLTGVHVVCWILTCFYEQLPWVGAIAETVVYTAILLFSTVILLEPYIVHEKAKAIESKPVQEPKAEEPKKEPKKEIEKPVDQTTKPIETKPIETSKEKPIEPITHVNME